MADKPITPDELAELLGESRRWVMRNRHRFPHYRNSKKSIRFSPEHVEQILTMVEQQPQVDLADIPGLTARSRTHVKNSGRNP